MTDGFKIRSKEELARYRARIDENAEAALEDISAQAKKGMKALFDIKFKPIGRHPTAGHPLNFVEQLNQTFTYLCALEGSSLLWELHPNLTDLMVFPGAHAPKGSLDIEARDGTQSIGAETFAAVTPSNNQKLKKDLDKLAMRKETFRYVFFISPRWPSTERQPHFERDGIMVWSIWPFAQEAQ